jgi:hypothetical protein
MKKKLPEKLIGILLILATACGEDQLDLLPGVCGPDISDGKYEIIIAGMVNNAEGGPYSTMRRGGKD